MRIKCQFLILIASCDSAFAGIFMQSRGHPISLEQRSFGASPQTIILPFKISNTIVQFVRTSFSLHAVPPQPAPFTIFNFLSLSTISGQCGKPFLVTQRLEVHPAGTQYSSLGEKVVLTCELLSSEPRELHNLNPVLRWRREEVTTGEQRLITSTEGR